MTRLIDADALKKDFKKSPFVNEVHLYYARQLINLAPTVEERPHGEWVKGITNDRGETYYHCSLCFAVDKMDGSQWINYCWKCGADMREEVIRNDT